MDIDIKTVKHLPRKVKRRIWLNWWIHLRDRIPGRDRSEQRANWRRLWSQLAVPNR